MATTTKNVSKASEQREELHRKIWAIADQVRGSVDGWDFKQYILGILFYRFISENLTYYINKGEHEAGDVNFDYAKFSDDEINDDIKKGLIDEKGFFIYPSQLFQNVVKTARTNPNLNQDLDKILRGIENSAFGSESEEDFKGLFADIDVTSNRLGGNLNERNKRLADILIGINEINFGNFEENEIDAFGDAYEFLISNYASNAGKSGGEFFTPQSVSKLLARLVSVGKTEINKVYDPTCGSGSLLLQMKKLFDKHVLQGGFYGQEINITNFNLARMNMFLHNVNFNDFSIKRGDTLLDPLHNDEKPFDAIVSNPPYSIKWVGKNNPLLINDSRFAPAGALAPVKYADYAFVMHSLYYLSDVGRAAIVMFPGCFYRGGTELTIRKYLLKNNFIEAIIELPSNLFFGTGITTNILVLSKQRKDKKVLFIDATKEFEKVNTMNILADNNIENIIDVFVNKTDKDYFSRYVDITEIAENDYNLSVSAYVEKEDLTEKVDIKELNDRLKQISIEEKNLGDSIDLLIKEIENV